MANLHFKFEVSSFSRYIGGPKILKVGHVTLHVWDGVPDIVNHAKFYQNRFRGFGSLSGGNLPFSYENGAKTVQNSKCYSLI